MHKVIRQMSQLRLQAPQGAALLRSADSSSISPAISPVSPPALQSKSLHTAASAGMLCAKWNKYNYGPRKWLEYNKTVHPPQETDEEPRNAVRYIFRTHCCYPSSCNPLIHLHCTVCLPHAQQHQIQSGQDVVHRCLCSRNVRRRGAEAAELCAQKGGHRCEGDHTGGPANGRGAA